MLQIFHQLNLTDLACLLDFNSLNVFYCYYKTKWIGHKLCQHYYSPLQLDLMTTLINVERVSSILALFQYGVDLF